MDKKDVLLVIGGFFFLLIVFFIGFSSAIRCFGPQSYPCDFSKIGDVVAFLLFSVLVIAIPIFYIIGSVDLISTKKIFKTKKIFVITFGLIIIIYGGVIFATGCKSHCTLKPSEHYISMNIQKLENGIRSESKKVELDYASVIHKKFTTTVSDKICFYRDDTLKIFFNGELLKTVGTNNLEIDEDPLCFEAENNEFGIRFEGLGDRTKISRIPSK